LKILKGHRKKGKRKYRAIYKRYVDDNHKWATIITAKSHQHNKPEFFLSHAPWTADNGNQGGDRGL